MNHLPFNLHSSLKETLKQYKEEELLDHLEKNKIDFNKFINLFVLDFRSIESEEYEHLGSRIIYLTLDHPEAEPKSVLKILELTETSPFFKSIFEKTLKNHTFLFKECLKNLKEEALWMSNHSSVAQMVTEHFIFYCQSDKSNASDLQERINQFCSVIPSFNLSILKDQMTLFNKALLNQNVVLLKWLVGQGILDHQEVKTHPSFYLKKAIRSRNLEILKLLVCNGLQFEKNGSEEIQEVIKEYGDARSARYPSSVEQENLKSMAHLLIAYGAKLPEEKDEYSSNANKRYETEIRQSLLSLCDLHENLTAQGCSFRQIDVSHFYTWVSYYPTIDVLMQKNPLILSLISENLHKATPQIQDALLTMLKEKKILVGEAYDHFLKQLIDNDSSCLRTLCRMHPPVKEPNRLFNSLTPFQYAVKQGSICAVKALFEFEENFHQKPRDQRLFLCSFILSQFDQYQSYERQNALFALLEQVCISSADWDLFSLKELNQLWMKLLYSSRHDSEQSLSRFLTNGLPFLLISDEKTGDTALIMALKAKKEKVAEKLMELSANTPWINQSNKEGKTALMVALEMDKKELISFLLDDGADIKVVSNQSSMYVLRKFIPESKKQEKKALKQLTTLKNLANLLADSFMKGMRDEAGNKLEGNVFSDSLDFINCLLDAIKEEMATDVSLQQILLKQKDFIKTFLLARDQLIKCGELAHDLRLIGKAPFEQKKTLLMAFIRRLAHQIRVLKKGDSLVMPCGWVSEKEGHAMLCVIRCTDVGQYECLSINTGEGGEFHASLPQTNKTLTHPICPYKGLSLEDVSDETFLQALFEPMIQVNKDKSDYVSSDFYDGIFRRFEHHVDRNGVNEKGYKTPQRAGSCSVKVVLAYLSFVLGEKSYKPLVYFLKKKSLLAVLSEPEKLKNQSVFQYVLRKSAESFCRSTLKVFKENIQSFSLKNLLEKVLLEDFLEILNKEKGHLIQGEFFKKEELNQLAEKLEKKLLEKHPELNPDLNLDFLSIREAMKGLIVAYQVFIAVGMGNELTEIAHENFILPSSLLLKTASLLNTLLALSKERKKIEEIAPSQPSSNPPMLHPLELTEISELKGSQLMDYLEHIGKFCSFYCHGNQNDQQAVSELISQTLFSLSLPKKERHTSWKELSLDQAEKGLKEISSLVETFFFAMRSSPIAFPIRIIALYKAQAIAFALACQIERERSPDKTIKLDQFGLYFSPLEQLVNDIHNVIYDIQTKQQLKETIDYFHFLKSSSSFLLFNYPNWVQKKRAETIQFPIPKEEGELIYFEEFYQQVNDWEEEDEQYEKINRHLKNQFFLKEWRLAKLWEGKKRQIPSYFLILRDLSLFSYLVTDSSFGEYCSYLQTAPFISLKEGLESLDVAISLASSLKKPLVFSTHHPMQIEPSNSYGRTHFPFKDKQKEAALHSKKSQNAYTIASGSGLEPLLSLTHQPLLTASLVRMWLSSDLQNLLNQDHQIFCTLALFCGDRLLSSLQADFSFLNRYLKTIDQNLAELSLMKTEHQKGKETFNEEEWSESLKFSEGELFFYQLRLRMLNQAQGAINNSSERDLLIKKEVQKTREQLMQLLKPAIVSNQKQAILICSIHLTLASSYLTCPPKDLKEVKNLIEHTFYAEFYDRDKKKCDPSVKQSAQLAICSSLASIKTALLSSREELESVFNKILHELYGLPVDSSCLWEGNFPLFKTEFKKSTYELNLLTGSVNKGGIYLNEFATVYEQEAYQQVFGSRRFSNVTCKDHGKNETCYEAMDEKGESIYFILPKEERSFFLPKEKTLSLRIERKIDGIHYFYVPWKEMAKYPTWPILPKQPNQQNYVIWQSLEDSHIKVIEKDSEKVGYIFTKEGKIQLPDGKRYEWIEIEKIHESACLTHFDDSNYILALKTVDNQEGNSTIEFCRYQDEKGRPVRFVNIGSKWVLEGDPTYFISKQQKLSSIPHFHRFLILENELGQRKALIVLKTFSMENTPDSFECAFIQIFSSEIEINEELHPENSKQAAITSYLYLLHRNYQKAMDNLEKTYQLQRYDAEELKYLGWILHSETENQDFNPDAIAIRNYASWLVHDNLFRHPSSFSSDKKQAIDVVIIKTRYEKAMDWELYLKGEGYWKFFNIEDKHQHSFGYHAGQLYVSYLNIKATINASLRLDSMKKGTHRIRLTRQEEIIWIQSFLKVYPHSQLVLRLSALAELENVQQQRHSSFAKTEQPKWMMVPIKTNKNTSSLGSQKSGTTREAIERLLNIFPRTRPGEEFLTYFLDLYLIATRGTEEEKKVLLHFLYDMRHEPNPQNQAYRLVLEALLLDPSSRRQIIENIEFLKSHHDVNKQDLAFHTLKRVIQNYLDLKENFLHKEKFGEKNELEKIHSHSSYIMPLASAPPCPSESDRLMLVVDVQERKTALKKGAIGKGSYQKVVVKKDPPPFLDYHRSKTEYEEKQYQKLLEEYREGCKKNGEQVRFIFDLNTNFKKWKADLEEREFEDVIFPYKQLEHLARLVNYLSPLDENPSEHISEKLKASGKKKETIALIDLFAAFVQQSKAGYQKLNPRLTEAEIQHIHHEIGRFFIHSLDRQKNAMTISVLKKLIEKIEANEAKENLEETMQELGELIDQDFDEELLISPPLLVFSYLMGKHVRPDQIVDIKALLGFDSFKHPLLKFPNLVIQKLMGTGKTLVIGTLMALLKADGYHLSILILPFFLYQTNAQDMKRRSEILFGQKTSTLVYKRDSAYFNLRYLTNIHYVLIEAIRQRKSVILSPESLQAMANEYWQKREELRILYESKKSLLEEENGFQCEDLDQQIKEIKDPLQILKEILKLIKKRGVFTFDEIDQTLDCRKELNFPVGRPLSIPKASTELLASLFFIAATDPEILKAGLHLRKNQQSSLPPAQYEEIKRILAKKILTEIVKSEKWSEYFFLKFDHGRNSESIFLNLEKTSLKESLKALLKQNKHVLNENELNAIYQQGGPDPSIETLEQFFSVSLSTVTGFENKIELIKNYGSLRLLMEMEAFITDLTVPVPLYFQKLYDSKNPTKMEAGEGLTLLRQELNEWLPKSWTTSAGEDYGFSRLQPNKLIAIPFSANNKPNELSEISSPWEAANKTLQLYLCKELTVKQTIQLIEDLQKKLRFEWSQNGYPAEMIALPTGRTFFDATGLDLLAIHKGDEKKIKKVQAALLEGNTTALKLLLNYVVDHVLPTIKIYPEQVTHNAQNLASMPKVKQGYAGVMENADAFPDDVEVRFDKGTNGQILEILLQSNQTVHVVEEGGVIDHLKEVLGWETLKHPHAHQFRAIIDLGPIYKLGQTYKEVSSEQNAREILTFMQSHPDPSMHVIQGVLYWDDLSNLLCCIKLGETKPIVFPATDPHTIASFSGLTIDQRFVFYPHHKLTGADLVLPKDAYALVTFSTHTPLRNFLQGVMRMRKFVNEGQHIETMVLRSTLSLIESTIGKRADSEKGSSERVPSSHSLNELILFAHFNTSEKQKIDLPWSTIQKISDQLRACVLEVLYQMNNDEEENRFFAKAKHLSIRKNQLMLFEKFSPPHLKEERSSEQVLLNQADFYLLPLTGYSLRQILSSKGELLPASSELSPLFLKAYQQVHQTIKNALIKLPPTLADSDWEWGQEATVEQIEEVSEQHAQEHAEQIDYYIELDTVQALQGTPVCAEESLWTRNEFHLFAAEGNQLTSYPLPHPSHPSVWPLKEVLNHHSILKNFAPCFGQSLKVSENFLKTIKNVVNPFDSQQKPVYQVLALLNQQTDQWTLVLVSLQEAAFFKQQLAETFSNKLAIWLLEPEGEVIQGGGRELKELSVSSSNELKKQLILPLFFMGNIKSLNTAPWFDLFKEWAQENKKLKKQLLESVILGREESAQSQYYQNSRVERVLNESSDRVFQEPNSSAATLSEELELGLLAVNHGRMTTALHFLEKARPQLDFNRLEHLNGLLTLAIQVIKLSSKLEEKKQAKRLLMEGLKQLVDFARMEKHLSSLETLTLLQGINDPSINTFISQIIFILIEKNQIALAHKLSLSRVYFYPSYPQKNQTHPLLVEKIKNLREGTIKILQLLGEKNPQTPLHVEAIKEISQKLLSSMEGQRDLIKELIDPYLNQHEPMNLNGLEAIIVKNLESKKQEINYEINQTFYSKNPGKKPAEIMADITHSFFKSTSMPLVIGMGIELLEGISKRDFDYRSKLPTASCISFAKLCDETGNPIAIHFAQGVLKQFKKTKAWEACSGEECNLIQEILKKKC